MSKKDYKAMYIISYVVYDTRDARMSELSVVPIVAKTLALNLYKLNKVFGSDGRIVNLGCVPQQLKDLLNKRYIKTAGDSRCIGIIITEPYLRIY